MSDHNKQRAFLLVLLTAALAIVALSAVYVGNMPNDAGQTFAQNGGANDWPTYMFDGARSGFNKNETRLSPANGANLKLVWKQNLGNVLAAQPIVRGDTVYVGSWSGFFHALSTKDGTEKWKADLGLTKSVKCAPDMAGITSAAAISGSMLYVGGGDDKLYALDPQTGKTLWTFKTGDNSEAGGAYNWDSPLVYHGRVYYGVSAFCDKPFPHGEMWGLNAQTGEMEQHTDFVPKEQKGGGLWTSPTVDEATGALFATTGSGDYYIPNSYSMVRLNPSTLAVEDAWQIPIDEQVFDGDWGTTPTLFKDKSGALMVGAAAKNGYYYAFKADNIHAGPAWKVHIADGGECPQCGEGAISSSAYAYDTIYVAGGYYALGVTQKFAGTVHALDPSTGAAKWIHPTTGSVLPALAVANGLVFAAGDDTVEAINAATGELVWEYAVGATIYAAPTVAGGNLYVASTDGNLYAFSAGPYPEQTEAYNVGQVGSNPPGFTPFRTPGPPVMECFTPGDLGHCVNGAFWDYFTNNGGVERFGPPVTEELYEAGRFVQYFRNAVLESVEKADGSGTEVRMGKLDFHLFYFRPEDENFGPARPQQGATFVKETSHNLSEPFLSYWHTHGEVAGLGYPVSEPFDEYNPVDGQTRRVQYFERSRLEIEKAQDGTEQVMLGALGLQKYMQRYGKLP